MIQSLKDILIVCDLDNTLLMAKEGLPSCNRTIIELFCMLGGRFTVASDRSPESTKRALDGLKLSCPAIVSSGAALYDFNDEELISLGEINHHHAIPALAELTNRFANLGVMVYSQQGKAYMVQANHDSDLLAKNERLHYVFTSVDSIAVPCAKIDLTAHPSTLLQVQKYLDSAGWSEWEYTMSSPRVLTITASQVTKGTALQRLCQQERILLEDTIAIGDYHGDISLLQTAGHGVAVSNAPQQVKDFAGQGVLACMDGGVGECLYALIKRYT